MGLNMSQALHTKEKKSNKLLAGASHVKGSVLDSGISQKGQTTLFKEPLLAFNDPPFDFSYKIII